MRTARSRLPTVAPLLAAAILMGFVAARAYAQAPAQPAAQEKAAPLRRIAIMPLVNLKPDKETDWLGKGTAETLSTNLMRVSGLILVEQTQLAAVLYQQDRQIADFADANTAAKVVPKTEATMPDLPTLRSQEGSEPLS